MVQENNASYLNETSKDQQNKVQGNKQLEVLPGPFPACPESGQCESKICTLDGKINQ